MLVLDDEFIAASELSEEALKLELSIWLFQQGKISSRKAAKLVGIDFRVFWQELNKRNIPLVSEATYIDEQGNISL